MDRMKTGGEASSSGDGATRKTLFYPPWYSGEDRLSSWTEVADFRWGTEIVRPFDYIVTIVSTSNYPISDHRVRILLTAFDPYDQWTKNASWESLMELLRVRGSIPGVITRRYPVELHALRERLHADLVRGFDAVLHLGQAPGISQLHLEAIALNVAGMTSSAGEDFGDLVPGGPVAFRSQFPLGSWATLLRQSGIPASVSFHAGTYLCNALMYLTHHWHYQKQSSCPVAFVHLPLTNEQVLSSGKSMPSMPVEQTAKAIGIILDRIRGIQPELPML